MVHLVILSRAAPYGSMAPREALDAALAAAAFDQRVTLVFDGDGCYQLLKGQQASVIGERNVESNIAGLGMFEVEDLRASATSLALRGMDPDALPAEVRAIDDDALAALIASADQVLSYG